MIDRGFGVTFGTIDAEHQPTLRAWRNDPRIWKWTRQNDLISEKHQYAWFEAQAKDPTLRMYLIHDKKGKPIGVCGLTSIEHINKRAEFSLYIEPESQGMGYGSAALKTLCCHGFDMLGLNCIWGETFEGNPAAGMFEALGF